jgi:hypothetical protein
MSGDDDDVGPINNIPKRNAQNYEEAKLRYTIHSIVWARVQNGFYPSLNDLSFVYQARALRAHNIMRVNFGWNKRFQPDSLQLNCCVEILKNLRDDSEIFQLPLPPPLHRLVTSVSPTLADHDSVGGGG